MTTSERPPDWAIDLALQHAAKSPCRSKRGVVIYLPGTHAPAVAVGHNGPPDGRCPGREVCAGRCKDLAVHAEMRALTSRTPGSRIRNGNVGPDLVHVEINQNGPGVAPCGGPSCLPCAKHIADCGWISGVWLYEKQYVYGALVVVADPVERTMQPLGLWHRYSADEFYQVTLKRFLAGQ